MIKHRVPVIRKYLLDYQPVIEKQQKGRKKAYEYGRIRDDIALSKIEKGEITYYDEHKIYQEHEGYPHSILDTSITHDAIITLGDKDCKQTAASINNHTPAIAVHLHIQNMKVKAKQIS